MSSVDTRTVGCRVQHPETSGPSLLSHISTVTHRRGTHLCLHHGRPLCPQGLHHLEQVHHALVAHPLQHNAECDEHASAPNPSTAEEQEGPLLVLPAPERLCRAPSSAKVLLEHRDLLTGEGLQFSLTCSAL